MTPTCAERNREGHTYFLSNELWSTEALRALLKGTLGFIILLLLPFDAHLQNYKHFRGNIHAHTGYSDGCKWDSLKTPKECFEAAKEAKQFDFLGISDHNHSGAGMDSLVHFHKGLDQADSANDNGNFVCFYGTEWGVTSTGGHVAIYGMDSLIGWETDLYDIYNPEGDYAGLFDIVNDHKDAFAYLCHPEDDHYDSIFHKSHKPAFDSAIVGMATMSGPAFSEDTTYSDPATSSYNARYKDLLGKDYHVALGMDHDNHYETFGRHTFQRTVVLADTLTRSKILNAYRNNRFYAAGDWNLKIEFTCNGSYMGTKLEENADPSFDIVVKDPDRGDGVAGDSVDYIRVKHLVPGSGNNPTSVETANDTNKLSFTHNINDGDEYYYYVKVRQYDDHNSYTAPIRFTKNTSLPVELTEFNASAGKRLNVDLDWKTASEQNSDHFRVERSKDSDDYKKIGTVQAAGHSTEGNKYHFSHQEEKAGTYYYRLVQVDRNGKSDTLSPESVYLKDRYPFRIHRVDGTARGGIQVVLSNKRERTVMIQLFDMLGQKKGHIQKELPAGKKKLDLPFVPRSSGIHWIRIIGLDGSGSRSQKFPVIRH